MISPIAVPEASANPDEHADWLELNALWSDDGNSSIEDLARSITRSGTADAVREEDDGYAYEDRGIEIAHVVAEDAFILLEERFLACGGEAGGYAFELGERYIKVRVHGDKSVYTFLLLLSKFGKDSGPRGADGAKIFERICSKAAESYFGGRETAAKSVVFGFPRRGFPRGFPAALDRLSQELGEGGGHRMRPTLRHQKDAKLDLVVWHHFADGKPGKMIGFGQCAAGIDWPQKLSELQPRNFWDLWLRDPPAVEPVKMFFLPHQVERDRWFDSCRHAGIVFDRCRIAHHASDLGEDLMGECGAWSRFVIEKRLKV